MDERAHTIRLACEYYGYRWPSDSPSGILYYFGERITIEEFNKQARLFRS